MKLYKDVQLDVMADAELVDDFYIRGFIPVAVEKRLAAEPLDSFVHPEQAVYVFGPEDGSLTPGLLHSCHRFVCIPTVSKHAPLNLAGAVNVVLYDRYAKERRTINERLLKTVGQDS